jgi:hypothetical protein
VSYVSLSRYIISCSFFDKITPGHRALVGLFLVVSGIDRSGSCRVEERGRDKREEGRVLFAVEVFVSYLRSFFALNSFLEERGARHDTDCVILEM